ncbi:carbohydrate ABC transporter permease [uncultured Robinsoniella sp.]|uniref:carbohydrate ABC transporter permease n=1 Tax=uncultured Robinsoniella sp. TaxID=904190 RepID=UPI00374F3B14
MSTNSTAISFRAQKKKFNTFAVICRVILISLVLIWIYPVLFSLQTSFKTLDEFFANIWALPHTLGVDNFVKAFTQGHIGEYFINSIIIAAVSLVSIEVISVMAAYSLARLRIPHTGLIIMLCFAIQLLPTETIIIPLYMMMSKLGMLGVRYLPIIIAYVGWSIPGTTIILKNFFDTIPKELLEAARIDGSGEVRNLFKIVLPLMKGALATCIVMNFTFVWGELMWAKTATITTVSGLPLTVGLMNFKGEFGTNWPLLCAAICMIVIPLYLVFLFLQKYFVSSLTAGSVKG